MCEAKKQASKNPFKFGSAYDGIQISLRLVLKGQKIRNFFVLTGLKAFVKRINWLWKMDR
jgi:hypothetical protein